MRVSNIVVESSNQLKRKHRLLELRIIQSFIVSVKCATKICDFSENYSSEKKEKYLFKIWRIYYKNTGIWNI